MVNSKILFDNLVQDLRLHEPEDEIHAIAFEVLGHFGISRTDVLAQKNSTVHYSNLLPLVERLNKNEPIQYVLGEAWFCGHKFLVNSSVLIPRPETELLVEEAVKNISEKDPVSVLDIGTGSGCIAISIALMFPNANVIGLDVSEEALVVASENAKRLNAKVQFLQHDILSEAPPRPPWPVSSQVKEGKAFDLIVSNPPYIAEEEKPSICKNVIDYEPHVALFAHKTDPLIFYRAIAAAARQVLNDQGKVMAEINERFGTEIESMFKAEGLIKTKIIQDLAGKDRVVFAGKG